MAEIIKFNNFNSCINITKVDKSRFKVKEELLLPATDKVEIELAQDHTSEPIKDINTINEISKYLIANKRYRDNMFFIVGINFGLRVSDLLKLRFINLINEDNTFKTTFPVLEQKTKNTRKKKKNRYITINEAVMDAVLLYLEHFPSHLDDYMFKSESNRTGGRNVPLTRKSADRILKNIASELSLKEKVSTHTLRKTFAYHQMVMSNNDPRKLLLLQKMFGHSSAAQTLDYIGITGEEIEIAYKSLNLGINNNYLVNSQIRSDENVSDLA